MINWKSFSLRRNITIQKFIEVHEIKNIDQFLLTCNRFGVIPPETGDLENFFLNCEIKKNELDDLKNHDNDAYNPIVENVKKEKQALKKSKKNQGVDKK